MSILDRIFGFKNQDKLVDSSISPTSNEFKKIINDNLFNCLKPLGFKRKGNNFLKEDLELNYYIQIQSSSSSTAKVTKLTLNLGIVSKFLIAKENKTNPSFYDSHWRERIGFFMDKPTDYWWIIDSIDSAERAAKEVVNLIENKVFKEWENIKSTSDLKQIWESGEFYGLSEGGRKHYLDLINNE